MLEWGQPHPGGKVSPAPKGLRRGCQGRQGARSHRADPGDGHEPMRRFIRLRPLDDLTIQIRNLLVEPMKRVDQDLEDWSGDLRERLGRGLCTPHPLGGKRRALWPHSSEIEAKPAPGLE